MPTGLSLIGLVFSSLMLCSSAAFPKEGLQNHSSMIMANPAEHLWTKELRQVVAEQNCSLFMQLAEAARRRRTRPLLEVRDSEGVTVNAAAFCSGIAMSFLAGLSTLIGAGIVFLLPGNQASPSQMSFLLAMAGGVMLSTSVVEFWLPVLTSFSFDAAIRVATYSTIGAALFLLLTRLVPECYLLEADLQNSSDGLDRADDLEDLAKGMSEASEGGTRAKRSAAKRSRHLAAMIMFSLTAHNFPEGFAVAVSSLGSNSSGFVVMIAIAFHNIPEGIAIAVAVLAATGSRRNAFWMTFLSGMAEPLGALLAMLLMTTIGIVSQDAIENLLCMVGGIMVAVAMYELLPEAWSHSKPVSFVMGAGFGSSLMLATIAMGA